MTSGFPMVSVPAVPEGWVGTARNIFFEPAATPCVVWPHKS